MELYGTRGQLLAPDASRLRLRRNDDDPGSEPAVTPLVSPEDDPFSWFAAVIRGETEVPPWAPGALDNNLLVMEILQAAMDSAARGETVKLDR